MAKLEIMRNTVDLLIVTALKSISGVVHVYSEDGLRAHWWINK